jgi:uncharacterized protein (TIGR03118 family)
MKPATMAALLLVFALPASRPALAQRFTQTNLVSDLPGNALHTDPNLVNPWGLAPGASGVFWTSNNVTGTSTLYDPDGTIRSLVVTIPGGAPTGIVATASTDSAFDIPNGATTARAAFIFVSQSGKISAWSPAVNMTNAIEVSADTAAVYTGAALGGTAINPRLYVADFKGGTIDVYDTSFAEIKLTGTFTDPSLPAGYYPFNVANVFGQLYVAYAQQESPGEEQPGPGLGIVSVFDFEGNFVRRFTTGGELNAPWAIVQAPGTFGPFGGDVLVGNFGDGRILAYDMGTGAFQGAVLDTLGNPIQIHGLWGLALGRAVSGPNVARRVYFAAGIEDETHGLFGYIAAVEDTTTPPPPIACVNEPKGPSAWRKLCGGPVNWHGHGRGDKPDGWEKGHGKGHDGDDPKWHGQFGAGSDSLDALFACIANAPAPNAFGANGCYIAGCDLVRKVGKRTEGERAAQVLLAARLNLCAGTLCDSLVITCNGDEGEDDDKDGVSVATVGEVADSLDALLCGNGDRDDIHHLVEALKCAMDSEDGDEGDDDQGDDDARAEFMQKIAVKTTGVNPVRLGDGPIHFAVNAAAPSMVQLRIYDVRGRLVAEPMRSSMVVGNANVTWDGKDFRGQSVVPGTYFYRAVTTGEAATGRLLIVR